MTQTTPQRLTAETAPELVKIGGCRQFVQKRVRVTYLRRPKADQWLVRHAWRTEEGFDRDHLSEAAVPGMEGTCHDSLHYDFGSDVAAAIEYFYYCADNSTPKKLNKINLDA